MEVEAQSSTIPPVQTEEKPLTPEQKAYQENAMAITQKVYDDLMAKADFDDKGKGKEPKSPKDQINVSNVTPQTSGPSQPRNHHQNSFYSGGKEIKINAPKPFDGTRTKYEQFMQSCWLNFSMNPHVYDSDEKKIAFVLSYMTKGAAELFKKEFIRNAIINDKFGKNYTELVQHMDEAFLSKTNKADALLELGKAQQKDKSAEDHILNFKLLVSQAGIDPITNNLVLADYFQRSLNPGLQQKILNSEQPPNTLDEWYKKAQTFDSNWRKMMAIMGRKPIGLTSNNQERKLFKPAVWRTFQRDPNAMDVDSLTMEE